MFGCAFFYGRGDFLVWVRAELSMIAAYIQANWNKCIIYEL